MREYKGESPAKKLARANWWAETHEALGVHWNRSRFLVLAGHGGDVSTLLSCGVDPEAIVAVDRDEDSIQRCRERFGGVRIEHGDVAEIAKSIAQPFGTVFLDFCSSFHEGIVRTIYDTAAATMGHGSFLGVGLLRGREKPKTSRERAVLSLKSEDIRRKLRRRIPELAKRPGHIEEWEDARVNLDTRGTLLGDRLNRLARVDGWRACAWGEWRYQSATEEGAGVPMGYYRYRMFNIIEWKKMGFSLDDMMRIQHRVAIIKQMFDMHDSAENALRWNTLQVAHETSDEIAGLRFNVEPSTIVAWRAHARRGTYGSIPEGFTAFEQSTLR